MRVANRRVVVVSVIAVLTGCGGGGGGTGGGGGGGEATAPTTATVSSADERTAHPLQGGRYRLVISAPDCESTTVSVTQENCDFRFERKRPNFLTMFVSDVPTGTFFIEQTDPSCREWTITMDRVSG